MLSFVTSSAQGRIEHNIRKYLFQMNPLLLLLGIIFAASALPAPSDVIVIESSNEAKSIQKILSKFDIYCNILKWNGKKPKTNIQGIARKKRYDLLKKACSKKKLIIYYSDIMPMIYMKIFL